MTTLARIMDTSLLNQMIDEGYIRKQVHPDDHELVILNYTEKAAFGKVWNDATLQCRGLIVAVGNRQDHLEDRVIARPFPKFFNHGENGRDDYNLFAPVEVTDKKDGCFLGTTKLNLWGGGTISIGDVVRKRLSVVLVGMNEQGEPTPALVTDWHNNGRKDNWLDVTVGCRVSRFSGDAGHPNKLRVTSNHQLHANGGYLRAEKVWPGDSMLTQVWSPSPEIIRLIQASLLGDGCVVPSATKPGVASYQEPHVRKVFPYVEAIRKTLGDCAVTRPDTISGYGSTMSWAGSREYPALGDLRQEWYPEGVKRVPADLTWLDDFAVAKWYMDDGNLTHSEVQRDRAQFSTHAFPQEDVKRLAEHLMERYGISCTVFYSKGWAIRVNAGRDDALENLWSAIAPHIHPVMRYKLPERWRDEPYLDMPAGHEVVSFTEVKVLAVEPVEVNKRNFPAGRVGFDVTTTTGNYMAKNVLVHNSLGILYYGPDGPAIATRGSFASDQALHATKVYQDRYEGTWMPDERCTYLFEIVFPANRIVLDYGDMDDLVLIGAVRRFTGELKSPKDIVRDEGWQGPVTEVFPQVTLFDALKRPPRAGAEGLVVRYLKTREMVKLKQEDYVALHRIIFGLNERAVWQQLLDGKSFDDINEGLPEEFQPWVEKVSTRLWDEYYAIANKAVEEYNDIRKALNTSTVFIRDEKLRKKLFASHAVKSDNRGLLFSLYDDKSTREAVFKMIRPGDVTYSKEAA